ncbi:hypothetical protein J421_4408 [Gemmatirosa kalamazoonensis]|uniref:Type 4 fimbrial biogenesis protein PilX N-terminal domain-containing protein n=1 Tax=Gemmatirosa kalamazoonensis TaxID=861299 RepID=W0RNN2_9BACT|nr:PilX N-terminal domain-containing pilus assembly protein [Gemmatirosa kalamazoonensis]AHG91945.1 hypothetical protein J421_4408 [Gemmatirosa kalamazoonensis]
MTRALRVVPNGARRGAALAVVLWLVVLLSTLGATVVVAARDATGSASNLRARAVARYAAESGVVAAVHDVETALAGVAADATARRALLNGLEAASARTTAQPLGEARYQAAVVDASARIDVNLADADVLDALLARVGPAADAREATEAIRRWTGAPGLESGDPSRSAMRARRALRTLDDLARIPGVSAALARAAAPYLTVDGDGQVNVAAAPEPVRAAARGALVQEPTRLVIVSRGWLDGHPLTHEIQAVYAVRGARLAFVRWRERDL